MQKAPEILNSVSKGSDGSILSIAVDPETLLRCGVQRLQHRREEAPIAGTFQALFAEATQELASLLRDVTSWEQGARSGGTQNQPLCELLKRAVRCATKQYMLQAELGNLALKDDLTGFCNRRGFQTLAERQLKLGRRSGREMLLFFIDVDGLKQINDSFGHAEGDRALKRTAEILKNTFRDSDIIARLGGDEFAVLAIEARDHSEAKIMARLRKYLKIANAGQTKHTISLSVGVARFHHSNPTSIRKLLVRADQAMYGQKRGRSSSRSAMEAGYLC
jgi:diguanylate cyclase (GGDEF)-like protein